MAKPDGGGREVRISTKPARRSLRASSRCEIGTSLGMNRAAVDVHSGVTRLARLLRANLFARLQTTFDGVHRIAIRLNDGLAPSHAAANGRHFRREHPVLVLKVIDLELVIVFHADNIDE